MVFAIWMIAGGVFGIAAGWLAIARNRSGLPWWALGVVLGPIAIAVVLTRGHRPAEVRPAVL